MNIFIEKENKQLVLDKSCTGAELLQELAINPATVFLVKNGEVVLLEEKLSKADDIKILSVISGG